MSKRSGTEDDVPTSDANVKESILEEGNEINSEFLALKNEANLLFVRDQNYEAALKKYDEALSKTKTLKEVAMIHFNKGQTYETMKMYAESLGHYREAVVLDSDNLKYMRKEAKLYVTLAEYRNAKESLFRLFVYCARFKLKINKEIYALWEKVKTNLATEKATAHLTQMEKDGKSVKPLIIEIEEFLFSFACDPVSLMWRGKWSAPGDAAISKSSSFKAAVKALQDKNYSKIIELCDEELKDSTECNSDNADAYLLRGTFRYLWGMGKMSLDDFLKVLNSEDENVTKKMRSSAAVKCGLYYCRWTEDKDQTLEWSRKAEELWGENCDLFYHRGNIFLELFHDAEAAVPQFEQALKLCPPTAWNVLYRVSVLYVTFAAHGAITYIWKGDDNGQTAALIELEPEFQGNPKCYELLDKVLYEFNWSKIPDIKNDINAFNLKGKILQVRANDPRHLAFCLLVCFNENTLENSTPSMVHPIYFARLYKCLEDFGECSSVCHTISVFEFHKQTEQAIEVALTYARKAVDLYRGKKDLPKYILNLENIEFCYKVIVSAKQEQ